ncbi:hypothetical protein AVEN_50908-1 [Araneus ventricosus]|uniref:Uncharacterized protein n=1 Tax=Araneus ventricosus TaxID=182803 RepID=A0A4Y2DXV0_ARAVE|nr:hypothetical protein AVEN_50908-1 [Araneus ventricosus]
MFETASEPTPHSLNFHITFTGVSLILDFRFSMRQISVHRESLIETGFKPGSIFTNPTLIELRQEIRQYDWLASSRADDVVLCSCA